MMDERETAEQELDELFAQASQDGQVPKMLHMRVLEDASRVQPVPWGARRRTPARGFGIFELLGGWRGVGGLVTAACTGLWIGINPPESVRNPSALIGFENTENSQSEAVYLTAFGWDVE